MICIKCKGQVRDSFHNTPIGLTPEGKPKKVSPELAAKAKELGIKTHGMLPTTWCSCKIKEYEKLLEEVDQKIAALGVHADILMEQIKS